MDGQMRDAYTLTINGEQYEIPEEFYNAYQDTKTVNTTDANTIKRWTGYELSLIHISFDKGRLFCIFSPDGSKRCCRHSSGYETFPCD